MLRKKVLFAGMLALLALAILVSSSVAQDVLYVFPFQDGWVYTATDEQPILFIWAWWASTKGLVKVFLNHSSQNYVLSNSSGDIVWSLSPDTAQEYFSPALPKIPREWGLDCPMPIIYGTVWTFIHDPLPPGVYTLVFTESFDRPVNDGLHVCTVLPDGNPVAIPPSLYRGGFSATSTIIVEDAEP